MSEETNRLKEFFKKHSVSLREIARRIGESKMVVYRVLSGDTNNTIVLDKLIKEAENIREQHRARVRKIKSITSE